MSNAKIEAQLAHYERIVRAAEQMTKQEQDELAEWEKENETENGEKGACDWPGWEAVVTRISH
ncbi:hypothetical protein [Pseudomonas saliphila]|uniref:hypothetical protein n=1 Tax=Pseudomonas saliphila TaxID=2586906 RepID=UPI00123C271D|nr:hypothetical protein [Pseudomonas saliphila]